MVVFLLERVPKKLRGELSRWMIEPKTGVFVGNPSAVVRDRLWQKVCEARRGGGMLIHNADNEQGFAVKTWGKTSRTTVESDGLVLIGRK